LLGQAFNRKTVRQRFAIVSAGPLANFLLALVFFWVLAMLGTEQVRPVVGAVEAGSLAERAGLMAGQEIVEVNGKPTAGWADVNLQLIRRLGESGSLEMLVSEVDGGQSQRLKLELKDWLKGAEEPDPIGSLGIRPWRPEIAPVVAQLDPEGPAQAAGVQIGDRLVSLDAEALTEWQEVIDRVRPLGGQAVLLRVERNGEQIELPLTLAERGEGGERRGYLGAGVVGGEWPPEMLRQVSHGPVEAVGEGLRRTWTMSVLTLDSLKKMLFGELSVKNLSGPITIAKVAGASAQSGVGDFLNFLAYLSISLGVLNLLPIPVLDGGHLLFYLVEWVRGRPLSDRVQGWGVQIGISLVVGVMLLALVNDLGRL
ncbi:MAG: RIP metalloprotease RseP, partial [Pseudomonadales bacterium]